MPREKNNDLLTHQNDRENVADAVASIKERIVRDFEGKEKDTLLMRLDELGAFDLGRFLIMNKGGLNGYWTNYIISADQYDLSTKTELERFLLLKAPVVLATRARFKVFQEVWLKNVQSHGAYCSIPCGLMADLTTLELDEKVEGVSFVGFDLDEQVLESAQVFASQQPSAPRAKCSFFKANAWDIPSEHYGNYKGVTSNGLNLYVQDKEGLTKEEQLKQLYQGFFNLLEPGGLLVTSFLTFPPKRPNGESESKSEWDLESGVINQNDLMLQKIIFGTLLQATWANYTTSTEIQAQLESVGFKDVKFIWGETTGRMFPTVLASKPAESATQNNNIPKPW